MTAVVHNAKHVFAGGVTDTNGVLRSLGTVDPRRWAVFYEDWAGGLSQLAAGDFESSTAETDVHSGRAAYHAVSSADDVAELSFVDSEGGNYALRMGIESNSTDKTQQLQVAGANWVMTAGVPMVFETRFRVTASTLASQSFAIGLMERETAIDQTFAAGGASFTADNFWGIYAADSAGSTLTFAARVADVQTTGPTATIATATWYTATMVFDGTTTRCYLDGVEQSTQISAIVTNAMTPGFYAEGGAAEDQFYDIDYILVARAFEAAAGLY